MVIHKLLLKVVLLGALLGPYHNHITQADDSMGKPGCQSSCGDVVIPYPFGSSDSGSNCRIDRPSFTVYCDHSTDPPIPYMHDRSSNFQILNISVENHEMRVTALTGRECYNSLGRIKSLSSSPSLNQPEFPIPSTKNKFIAIGCDTSAFFLEGRGKFSFGCMSSCSNMSDVSSGSCSGVGCCETTIPRDLFSCKITIQSFSDHANVISFNPCSYAFVAENGFYNFSADDLSQLKFNQSTLVLDWAIGNQTCEDAKKNNTSYMCTKNTKCTDAQNGSGYKCTCLEGYQGNPYLTNGCHDIDECADPEKNPCEGICHNVEGGYRCSCPKGYHGDGKKGNVYGQGCAAHPSHLMKILFGVAVGIIVLLFSIGFLYLVHKKKKLIRLKAQNFTQNGGLHLQRHKDVKIFSSEELKKATDNYDESRIVGRVGYGNVYKGSLSTNMVVTIKKASLMSKSQVQQFVNEVIILSQIDHPNIVRFVGCCLETEVPLLVYEFVNNGTLFDHIHTLNKSSKISWETKLKIASETAGALSYLHSRPFIPIIHRDVKSANILLDANYTAKVSDFGVSRIVPLDQKQLSTMFQGTLGYLDPEYRHTGQLTEKSDVYSFGIVLVELLTGKKAFSFDRPEEERNLATYFLSSLENGTLFQDIAMEGNDEQVKEVANIARRCLRNKGEDRPTMKEVASELEGLRAMANYPWVSSTDVNQEETVLILGEETNM